MKRNSILGMMFGAVCLLAAVVSLAGGDGRCDRCGCCCECQKVCRVVCEMKEHDKVCYSCKCEDFCVPGRSEQCGDCNCKDHQVPTAAYVKTKRQLVKTVVKEKKPHYKLVVENLCPNCCK
jgi:hypothetical protein